MWSHCAHPIRFELEEYKTIDPEKFGWPERIEREETLNQMAKAFWSPTTLLVVTTGRFREEMAHSKSWFFSSTWLAATLPPTEGNPGISVIPVQPVMDTIAPHEFGHYLGLDHDKARSNLMHDTIDFSRRKLTLEQCDQATRALESPLLKPILRN